MQSGSTSTLEDAGALVVVAVVAVVAVESAGAGVTGETTRMIAVTRAVSIGGFLQRVPPDDRRAACSGSYQH